MKKLTLLAISAMFSFAGLAQAEECATSKCKTACATKAKTECATKEACATKCATTVATKEVCASKCATTEECATKCADKCEKVCATKKECATTQCATKKECATSKCAEKKECATSKCATKCDATAKVAHFNVAGMTCTGCSTKLTKSLNALEGVTVKKVCHKSGCVDVVLGEKATPCQVKKAITATGLKVVAPKKG